MRIVFLHLSDFHIKTKESISPIRIQSLVKSLAVFLPFDGCVIIASGDIASSGEKNQYKFASRFFGMLKTEIFKEYSELLEKDYKLLIVPGNHDINYYGKSIPSASSIKRFCEDGTINYYDEELNRMRDFFDFSNRNECFFKNKNQVEYGQVVTRKILHFSSGYRIEANLINSAPYSCSDDNGLHSLPEEVIPSLRRDSKANISLIVMHHSPVWFNYNQRKDLEIIISQRCSLAFYGHEHFPETQTTIRDDDGALINQAGAAWWQQSSPNESGYYSALFDTEELSYTVSKFMWENSSLSYKMGECIKKHIELKPLNGRTIQYREEFVHDLMRDEKHNISENISNYFVFPKLSLDVSKEYTGLKAVNTMGDLIKIIDKNRFVAITGDGNRGKTTLLKMLFDKLKNEYTTLYCGIDDISGKKQDRVIRELVYNTFGDAAYAEFLEKPKEHRIIIIDDAHLIRSKHLSKFLSGLENVFEHIIVALEDNTKFDIVQMVKDNIQSENEFIKVSIDKLYATKRQEVIESVVCIKNKSESLSNKEISRSLEQYINTYKLAFRTEIDFVVQFADYYCSHLGELEKSDATVFSKVFENSIEQAVEPCLTKRGENVNDVIVALGEIAHYIHFNREYPITAEHIDDVIKTYQAYYDNAWLTTDRFLEIAEQGSLLIKTSDGYRYRFKTKDYLAYFVAKALNRKFHDDGNLDNLELVVEQSGFGINSDILMFLTYIADNVNIPRLLLKQACIYTQDWEEYQLGSKDIKYLFGVPEKKMLPPVEGQRQEQLEEQSSLEAAQDEIETLDIYDYDVSQIDELNYQLIRSLKQLRIISKCFSSFVSMLPSKDKQKFAMAIYKIPNKIFCQWATSVDNNIDALIDDIIEWQEQEESIGKKADREKVLEFFQTMSIELLLNLYYEVSAQGINGVTVDYLCRQPFIVDSSNYQIERMMFYEKVDDYRNVLNDAEKLYAESNSGMIKRMILSIIRHMLINSDKMTAADRRNTTNKYFSPKGKTNLLIDRKKALSQKS